MQRSIKGPAENEDYSKLTIREVEVLKLICEGNTTKEIGEILFLSQSTVASHRHSLMKKLKAKNVVQLVIIGLKQIELSQSIIREIEFPPNFAQAGLSLLNQFSRIISKKYPQGGIAVKIEQEGDKIRFLITTDKGEFLERIENDLSIFGKIMRGENDPSDLINDPEEVRRLQERLKMVALELNMTKAILNLTEEKDLMLIQSQERDKKILYSIIDKGVSNLIFNHKQLKNYAGINITVYKQIAHAIKKVENEIEKQEVNSGELIKSLNEIKKTAPSKAKKVGEFFLDIAKDASKTFISEWIKSNF